MNCLRKRRCLSSRGGNEAQRPLCGALCDSTPRAHNVGTRSHECQGAELPEGKAIQAELMHPANVAYERLTWTTGCYVGTPGSKLGRAPALGLRTTCHPRFRSTGIHRSAAFFLSMNNPFQGDLPIRSNVNVVLRQLGTGSGRGCNSCLHTLALPQVGSCGAGGVHAWGQTSPPNLTSPRNESVLRPCVNGITWIQCEQAPQCSCHASRGPSGWGLIADALRGRGCRYNHDSEPWACQKERDDDSCRLLT